MYAKQAILRPSTVLLVALMALAAMVLAYAASRGVHVHTGAMFHRGPPKMHYGAVPGMFHD